jgi:hypothetical protein
MFFEQFYEDLGAFDDNIIEEFKQRLFDVDLSDPKLTRPEYCFRDGGKLILPLHFAQVRNEEYYKFVEPLIKLAQGLGHKCLEDTVPFRIEISIIEPGKNVLWHHDQHTFHKFSERLHFPIITNDEVEFIGKWFLDKQAYKFKMKPGRIYRFNNRSMHSVKNPAGNFRCHVMIDFIHKNILNYFLHSGNIEKLAGTVTVTPADEIYYFINNNMQGVEPVELTEDDIQQLKTLKNY